MDRQPEKVDAQGQGLRTLFPHSSVSGQAFVAQRDQYRKKLCMEVGGQLVRLEQVLPGRAPYLQNDLVENLVDVPADKILRTLEDMEARGLRSGKVGTSPWSDWYWPIYQGLLAARYADDGFPLDSKDWKEKRNYVRAHSALDIMSSGDQAAVNGLSAAEKYDLLVGDLDFSLTQAQWQQGQGYFDSTGSVETWMGICHGWSPASYMVPRPTRALQVLAANGRTRLLFYPSDLKGLASLLWARTNPPTRFIGGRCNDKSPATDENGRLTSQDCFDSNPATWHMCAVNQLGLARRPLIIDATFDYEVWNQPCHSYSYGYFSPRTLKPVATLAEAVEDIGGVTRDRFRKYRSPAARYLAGIAMSLTYVAEVVPTGEQADSPAGDFMRTVSYTYDLELDEDRRIIGGEWYENRHPDFIWTPAPEMQALATTDYAATGSWDDDTAPASWRQAAISAAKNGQPLAKIVNTLVQWSRELG